jgi:hypothetical protein
MAKAFHLRSVAKQLSLAGSLTVLPDPIDDRTPLMLAACSGDSAEVFEALLFSPRRVASDPIVVTMPVAAAAGAAALAMPGRFEQRKASNRNGAAWAESRS